MIAFVPCDIYCQTDTEEMAFSNKLFCTFVEESQVDYFIEDIKQYYTIAYNKIFVLYVKSNNEYVCTYNIVENNIDYVPEHTILVHRKKDSNTLYTINALNELIKRLNDGVVDTNYKINWQHYKNTILLTQHDELKQLKTKIHKIVEL
jgi:hypothetical protein